MFEGKRKCTFFCNNFSPLSAEVKSIPFEKALASKTLPVSGDVKNYIWNSLYFTARFKEILFDELK